MLGLHDAGTRGFKKGSSCSGHSDPQTALRGSVRALLQAGWGRGTQLRGPLAVSARTSGPCDAGRTPAGWMAASGRRQSQSQRPRGSESPPPLGHLRSPRWLTRTLPSFPVQLPVLFLHSGRLSSLPSRFCLPHSAFPTISFPGCLGAPQAAVPFLKCRLLWSPLRIWSPAVTPCRGGCLYGPSRTFVVSTLFSYL